MKRVYELDDIGGLADHVDRWFRKYGRALSKMDERIASTQRAMMWSTICLGIAVIILSIRCFFI